MPAISFVEVRQIKPRHAEKLELVRLGCEFIHG
jgi:hypothetical protein